MSRMMRTLLGIALPAALLCGPAKVQAQHLFGRGGDCYSCQRFHCPPGLKHCQEGPPHIHIHRGCPKPICNPCQNPNWGYFEPCWNPWPWPPDYSHCRVPPPAASVILDPGVPAMPAPMPMPRQNRPGL